MGGGAIITLVGLCVAGKLLLCNVYVFNIVVIFY